MEICAREKAGLLHKSGEYCVLGDYVENAEIDVIHLIILRLNAFGGAPRVGGARGLPFFSS